jgi:hypothetical protein
LDEAKTSAQRAIDNSPRKRHHIRFWAKSLAQVEADVDAPSFWRNTDRPNEDDCVLWVGAGTKDTGFSLTRLTFQVTQTTDSDTNAERDYIINVLNKHDVIENVTLYKVNCSRSTSTTTSSDGEVAGAEGLVAGFLHPKRDAPGPMRQRDRSEWLLRGRSERPKAKLCLVSNS